MGVGQGQRCLFSEPDKLLGNKRQTLDVCCCRRIGHLNGLSREGLAASNKLPLLFFIQNPALPKSTLRRPQFVSVVKYAFLQMSFSRPPLNSFLQNTAQTHICAHRSVLLPAPSPPPHTHHRPTLLTRGFSQSSCALSHRHHSSWEGRCVPVCVHEHPRGHMHSHTHTP